MFKYYMKKVIGNKSFLFWTMMFPICLMICFKIAFGGLYDIENNFDPVEAVYINLDSDGTEAMEVMLDGLISKLGLTEIMQEFQLDELMRASINGDKDFVENFEFDQELFESRLDEIKPQLTYAEDFFDPAEFEEFEGFGKFMKSFIFRMALDSTAGDEEKPFFNVTEVNTVEEAETLLDEGEKHVAFIYENGEIRTELASGYSDVDLIVTQSFLSTFDSMYSVMEDEFSKELFIGDNVNDEDKNNEDKNSEALDTSLFSANGIEAASYVKAKESIFEEEPNPYNWYYYSTFVMGIMFNILTGIGIVADVQANLTKGALRVGLSSTSKSKIFLSAFTARFCVLFTCECIQLLVMNYIFKIPVGHRIPQLIMFMVISIIFTLSVGEIFGLFLKGDVSKRENKANALLMTSVFLSGEMMASLPGVFEANCPIINKINPATILNFSFYNLVFYEDLTGFYMNMLKISVVAVVFIVISIAKIRRQKYASL